MENANIRVGKEKLQQTLENWDMKFSSKSFYLEELTADSDLELKKENPDVKKLKDIYLKLSKEYSTLAKEYSTIADIQPFTEMIMELRLKSELADSSVMATARITILLFIVGCNGILLMTYGFTLWYFRLQKYQDLKLKKEAENI